MKTKSISLLVAVFIIFASGALFAESKKLAQTEPVVSSALPPLCETMGVTDSVKCKNLPILKSLGCDDIKPPPLEWGGLDPHLAMGVCVNFKGRADGRFIRRTGCSLSVNERYIVVTETKSGFKSQLLNDKTEFKKYFAPIRDNREALSYIVALTGSLPIYEFSEKYFIRTMEEDGKFVANKPKATEVWEKKDGYHVRLFDHQRCGCHRPELYEIEYVLTKEGDIAEKSRKTIWQANRLYNICID